MSAPPNPAPPAPPDFLAVWPRSAQLAASFLIGVATTLIAVHVFSSWRGGSKPSELERGAVAAYRIDLNRAGRAELLQLPGVGVALVERLEASRREQGPFRGVEDLTRVHGIGPTTVERLRPWVYVRPEEAAAQANPNPPAKRQVKSKKAASLTAPINVNIASFEDLQRLPGIGPKMARRIIDERQKAPFRSVAELRRVPGIGPKTLERLRPYVIVRSDARQVVLKDEF
jgi:competence protein ComEA